jgi:small-conductance mechanosensitive channel
MQVNVPFEADADRVERVLLEVGSEALNTVPGMAADSPPSVALDFGDSGLVFTLNYQVEEFSKQFAVRH